MAVVGFQPLLSLAELRVIVRLASNASRHNVRDVVIFGNAGTADENFHKVGDHEPNIRFIAHNLQIHVLGFTEGVQNQQFVGSQRHQDHGNHGRH